MDDIAAQPLAVYESDAYADGAGMPDALGERERAWLRASHKEQAGHDGSGKSSRQQTVCGAGVRSAAPPYVLLPGMF
ncbi:hypothetical protein Cmtc_63220 [Cupriavidus sp. TKC]|nr:hypothetical protein Cmtc_63220 [Cupriavidus sp. TKC]